MTAKAPNRRGASRSVRSERSTWLASVRTAVTGTARHRARLLGDGSRHRQRLADRSNRECQGARLGTGRGIKVNRCFDGFRSE